MPQQAEVRVDFSGGVNAKASPHAVPDNALYRGFNVMFDEAGAVRTRDGYVVVVDASLAPTVITQHRFFGRLITTPGGLAELVVSQDQASSLNQLWQYNATPWTLLGTSNQNYSLVELIQFSTIILMTDGYAPLKYYNPAALPHFGTIQAAAGQTIPAGGLHAINHLNTIWVWNTADTRSGLEGPSSLRACDVNNVNSWPNSFQVFLGDDSDKGMGMASFAIAETGIAPFPILVCFKGFSAYQVTGLFGQANFSIQQIRTDQGCVAPRSIKFCPGLGIIRLTTKGFYLYDGLNDTCISTEIDPYIFGINGLQKIELGNVLTPSGVLAHAELYQDPAMYVCVCSLGGVVRRWFCFDLARKNWTVFDVLSPAGQGLTALNVIRGAFDIIRIGDPGFLVGFDHDRAIYQFGRGVLTDGGLPIRASVRLGPLPRKSPLRRAYYRRMLAKVYNVTQGQTVSASFAIGPAQNPAYTGGMQTIPASSLVTAQPVPQGTFDTAEGLAGNLEVDLNYDIGRTGELLHTELTWTGPLTLRAVEWHGMPKLPSRPART